MINEDSFFVTHVGMSPSSVDIVGIIRKAATTGMKPAVKSTSQLGGCFNKFSQDMENCLRATKNIWTCNSINSLWWKLVKENNTQLSTNFQVNLLCWIVPSLSLVGIVRWSSIRLLHPTSNSTKNVSQKNVLPISLSLSAHLYIPQFAYWKIYPMTITSQGPLKCPNFPISPEIRKHFIHDPNMSNKNVFTGNPNDVFSLFISGKFRVSISPTFGCLPRPFADLFLDSNPMYMYLLDKSPSADYYVVSLSIPSGNLTVHYCIQ